MGHWTRQAKIGPIDFDGDSITVFVERLSVASMQQMMPFMKQNDRSKEITVTFEDSMKMIEVATKIIPKYVKNIDGMKDGEGNVVTAEKFNSDLINEFYFMEFTASLLAGLCEISVVQENDEKNSVTPSDVRSLAQSASVVKSLGVN